MQGFDVQDIELWCEENGNIPFTDNWKIPDNPALVYAEILRYPLDSENFPLPKTVTNACLEVMGTWDECLLWVVETGVHTYLEDWPAFYALRGEDGERNALWEKPGHLFLWEDRERLRIYLEAMVSNLWDALILPATHGQPESLRLKTSHDNCVDLWSRTPRKFPELPLLATGDEQI